MPEVFEARNVQEAVELAERFKDEGRYDWFRGQVKDWPPHSSLFRLQKRRDQDAMQRFEERMLMFFRWLADCKELEHLGDFSQPSNVHAVFAILQHYGIPTHYIDFSTDPGVAGFFSADTKEPPEDGTMSSIYCLDTKELRDVWDSIGDAEEREGAGLEPVTVDLTNLWRLEAQKGTFLYANFNWDLDFPMDRIVFPYGGYPPYPTRDMIYPSQKSPLEAVLDRYFEVERTTFAVRDIREFAAELESRTGKTVWQEWKPIPEGYHAPAFIEGTLAPLPSWDTENLRDWLSMKDETMRDASGPQVAFVVPPKPEPDGIRAAIRYGVGRMLRADKSARSKSYTFRLEGIEDGAIGPGLVQPLTTLWDGMRRLPYSDQDIAEACGSAAGLYLLGVHEFEGDRTAAFSRLFPGGFEVGFTNLDLSSSKGFVSRASLQRALRRDIADLLVEAHKQRASDCRELFRVAYSPKRLFEFPEFASVFAREVIPAQVLTRSFVIFSPAQLETFGLP